MAKSARAEDVIRRGAVHAAGDTGDLLERLQSLFGIRPRLELGGIRQAERRQGKDAGVAELNSAKVDPCLLNRESRFERIVADPGQRQAIGLASGSAVRRDDR